MSLIAKAWKILRDSIYRLEVSHYLIPFDELIKRCYDRMIIKAPQCPQCKNIMQFRNSNIVTDSGPVRDDQTYKCLNCFNLVNFGLPMSLKDAIEEKRLRGGQYLCRPTYRLDERELEVIKKRLKRLGYIE